MKRRNPLLRIAAMYTCRLFCWLVATAASQEDKFIIVVIPDSQQEVLTVGDNRLAGRFKANKTKGTSPGSWR